MLSRAARWRQTKYPLAVEQVESRGRVEVLVLDHVKQWLRGWTD